MTDSHNLVRFNLFQQLVEWLHCNQQDTHKGRFYLERHLPLTEDHSDKELERLIRAHVEEHTELKQQLEFHLQLLQEVRRRGGTRQAVRDAYVNHYGGLVLDIPDWLHVYLEQRSYLVLLNRPERTRRRQAEILQEALKRTEADAKARAEICAALRNEIGMLLISGAQYATQELQVKALEDAIVLHKLALKTFTPARYPLQHAQTQLLLGTAYLQYGFSGQDKMLEQAMTAFQVAQRTFTLKEHPEEWLKLQTLLGKALLKRPKGKPAQNIEQALEYQQTALQHITSDTPSETLALIHVHRGDCYYLRQLGERTENLIQAKNCYRQALHIFSPSQTPEEWATTHIRLAAIFQALPWQNEQQHDRNLHCAIVCYEEALRTYHPDVYLVEYASTLVSLGYTHKQRLSGDRVHNLQQASRCFRSALHVFTSNTFPAYYRQTLLSLAESERLRKETLQQQLSSPLRG
ncbi:hypothetical protein KSC_055530 [Ktedonobacter sp. SOSP1-52]|uniref:hypothetical protein n=1 Tax=Ktedonobacter sp. SOSP1-52 TaxID=2778366 RepID=UPI0019166B68|nr:hypothetical protein [Ktedonobacter sp. SOSP1-52]GHO66661.1 hypothetical protein KSC_055530 [Ktedonobacter sp. SOSP1-52]